MRVAYFSGEGSTLCWARRLYDEGTPILVYNGTISQRNVGIGIVPIASSLDQWKAWGNDDPNTIWFFDCTSQGDLAEFLRRTGHLVVGGGAFMDRLENDRPFGASFAAKHNILQPPTKTFSSVAAAIGHMKTHPKQEFGDGGWAWKPNKYLGANTTFVDDADAVIEWLQRVIVPTYGDSVSCIVQERIPGVALSTARWWNGKTFTGPYEGTLENKKLMNDNKGPATGCAFNTLWFYPQDDPKIAQQLNFEALASGFRKQNAPPGLYDINAVVDKRGAWFLEWTPRLGVDSEPTSQRGIESLTELLERLAKGGQIDDLFDVDRAYMSVRVTVPPYPCEYEEIAKAKKSCVGSPILGIDGLWQKFFVAHGVMRTPAGYAVADPYGIVGIAMAASTRLTDGYKAVYDYLDKKLRIPDMQYRTDAEAVIRKDIEEMAAAGYDTTDALEMGDDD